MICAECAGEADAVKSGRLTHRTFEWAAKYQGVKGGKPVPRLGHAGCKGCDCHHEKVKPAND